MTSRTRSLALLAAALVFGSSGVAGAQAFPDTTSEGLPNIQSYSAIIVDLDSGDVLYEKDADEVRYVASTSKIFTAMALRRAGLELDEITEITGYDQTYAARGARSRLRVGRSFRNRDLLEALLVASDNRAATALARAIGTDTDELVGKMNDVAAGLGLEHTELTDPSGLNGNASTARELAAAFQASMSDPLIAEIMGTETTEVRSRDERGLEISYRNTNRALHSDRYEVIAGKTGYTSPALYCLAIAAEIGSRRVAMVFLGSYGRLTRYGDFSRAEKWLRELSSAESTHTVHVGDVKAQVPAGE